MPAAALFAQPLPVELFANVGVLKGGTMQAGLGPRAISFGGGITFPVFRSLFAELDVQTSRVVSVRHGLSPDNFYKTRRTLVLPRCFTEGWRPCLRLWARASVRSLLIASRGMTMSVRITRPWDGGRSSLASSSMSVPTREKSCLRPGPDSSCFPPEISAYVWTSTPPTGI